MIRCSLSEELSEKYHVRESASSKNRQRHIAMLNGVCVFCSVVFPLSQVVGIHIFFMLSVILVPLKEFKL